MDDSAGHLDQVADWLVREVAPDATRSWADLQAKGHRGRWFARAETIAGLAPVAKWPTAARHSAVLPDGVVRSPPPEWTDVVSLTTGTGDLGWAFWSIDQIARMSRLWTGARAVPAGLIQHFMCSSLALRALPDDRRLLRVWATSRRLLVMVDPTQRSWSDGWQNMELDADPPVVSAVGLGIEDWTAALSDAIQ